jgi:hypothetical protein
MGKHAVATKLLTFEAPIRRDETLSDRLNRHILQTLSELRQDTESAKDPGIEDEYEFEIFGNAGPRPPPKKKK